MAELALELPLVSIGVPARNGGDFIAGALETLINQTYRNIEIIVSDNNSSDDTSSIIERYAALDSRILVIRQTDTLSAIDNFRFVFEQAKGEFFMWAACDDRRSSDFVESLIQPLIELPEASLSFGDVATFYDTDSWQLASPFPYPFETSRGETWVNRLVRYTRINCLHVYGLIRTSSLSKYQWIDIDNGPDIPLLVHLSLMGEFARASSGCFYYHAPLVQKTLEDRAKVNSFRQPKAFPEIRLAWACGLAAHHAGKCTGRPIGLFSAFAIAYLNRHWRWIKPWLFERTPSIVVNLYRRFKHDRA